MRKTALFIMFSLLLFTTNLAATTLSAESSENVVRVGWFPYPLCSEYHDGKYSGYTYDYLMEMAKYTDWEYEFINSDFATCLKMLANGDLDIIGGLQQTPEREQYFSFAEIPYSQTYLVMFTRKDSPLKSYDYKNYSRLTVGILRNSNNIANTTQFAQRNGFSCSFKEYDTNEELEIAVENGDVDAGVLLSYIGNPKTRILTKFNPLSIRFITTKGNNKILSDINKAMTLIKINKVDFEAQLYQKYYISDESIDFRDDEIAILDAAMKKPIAVGVLDDCIPISYWNNKEKKYDGVLINLFDTICSKIGLKIKYVSLDTYHDSDIDATKTDIPQIILGVPQINGENDAIYKYLSDPLLEMPLSLVVKANADISWGTKNKTIAVTKDFVIAHSYINENMPGSTLITYDTFEQCLSAVAHDHADAAFYYQSSIIYYQQKPCYSKLKLLPIIMSNSNLSVASYEKENRKLLHIIEKGMSRISENEIRTIMLNETMRNTYVMKIEDLLYKFSIPIILITILILGIIIVLSVLYSIKRKNTEELNIAYQKIHESLIEVEKASTAKGTFMSRMSHEIRTPLNAVIGYNTIAQNELASTTTEDKRQLVKQKVKDCLVKSEIASRQLLTIINDVLDMSAIESGKIKTVNERFDFKGLISSLTTIFYSQAKSKGIEFCIQFDKQMDEWIIGDQIRLNQILTNLLSNAIKFTPNGGNVTLFIDPKIEEENIQLHFEVQDTGIGMTPEYLTRIWNPFEQEDSSISRRFGGTGLGLSITKTLVDLLGGTISVESTPGKGSTFFVNLTFTRTKQPQNFESYDFSSYNVLVVDDDPSTRNYMRLLLSRSGIRSTAVCNGTDAIAAVSKSIEDEDPYTLCFVDWQMPKMNGLETITHIRKIAGDKIPIIIISAYDFSEVVDKAADVGVNLFISKPLFQSSLFNLLVNISGNDTPRKNEKRFTDDFNGARVLLAEDNDMNMEIAKEILESVNLSIDCVWNGQEAVDTFLASPHGTYSVILMDVQMPVMDGYQATRLIRASEHPDAKTIPIIAMTADAFAENIAESRSAGMNEHIAKPIEIATLFRTLKKNIQI